MIDRPAQRTANGIAYRREGAGRPLVLVRGATLPPGDGSIAAEALMPPSADLFR